MFAIIDIETTGLNPKHDKITEICIIVHDGLTVVDKFSTLINPERRIPVYIERLTGITNEMVQKAPKFYEAAKQILDFTRDKVFVAHNADFDYGFVREEYLSLGYKYKRDTLCTKKLSRKLLPRRVSYGLKRLCESLQIPLENHHRAEADALATTKLFEHLLALKNAHPVYRRHNLEEINTGRREKIQQYILKKLPETVGIYQFLDREQEILYIGKSNNLRQRAIQHYNSKDLHTSRMLNDTFNVHFSETGSELIALLMESEEIKKHKPPYNRLRKKSIFKYAIDLIKHENGTDQLLIVPFEEAKEPLQSFTSWISARQKLEDWINENALCPKYVGLFDDDGVCFNHQIRKCNGICCGKEEPDAYNERVKVIREKYHYPEKNFVIKDAGRTKDEYSFVLILNGKFSGFGYLNNAVELSSPEDYLPKILPFEYYPDAEDLIRSWMKGKISIEETVE
jgi:DNA polymerase III subunit epsilon